MPKPIQSIERASAILRLLSGRTRRLSLAELAGELGLPKGTVYGILRTLLSVGFVEQDPESGKYRVGAALLHLGSSYLDGNELRARALNWSDWVAARTNESVRLGTLHDGQVLVVHHGVLLIIQVVRGRGRRRSTSRRPGGASAGGGTRVIHH